jgi:hypothetical protein
MILLYLRHQRSQTHRNRKENHGSQGPEGRGIRSCFLMDKVSVFQDEKSYEDT